MRNPGIHHITIGDITVTALNDGAFEAKTEYLVGIPGHEAEDLLRGTFRAVPPRITVSSFLVTHGGRHTLIDAGGGSAMGPEFGHQRKHLADLGIQPADIARICVTHAHVDHVMGLVDDGGAAWYPNAELVIHEAEPAFWLNDEIAAKAPEAAKDAFNTAKRGLSPYLPRMRTVKDGGEAAPGISAVHLPGHTPGHSGWMITSGAEALLVWGDVVHIPGVQFARPEAGMGFDTDIELGRKSRVRIFDRVASEGLLVAGMHLDFPCFGHVARAGGGYAFVPEVWRPAA